jgi:hypothetical protein
VIYGIEQTTDSRYPETVIRKFTSKKAALHWAKDSGGFAWAGGARSDIPVPQQNWHSRLRDVYEMPSGWRPPSITEQRKYVERYRGSSRRVNMATAIANAVIDAGERIEEEQ